MSEIIFNADDETQIKRLFYRLYCQIDAIYAHFSEATKECRKLSEKNYIALEEKMTDIERAGDELCHFLFADQLPSDYFIKSSDKKALSEDNPTVHMIELLGAIENYGKFCKTMANASLAKSS